MDRIMHILVLYCTDAVICTIDGVDDKGNKVSVTFTPEDDYSISTTASAYFYKITRIGVDRGGTASYTNVDIVVKDYVEPGKYYIATTFTKKIVQDKYKLAFPINIERNDLNLPVNNFIDAILLFRIFRGRKGLYGYNIETYQHGLDIILKIYWEINTSGGAITLIPPKICDSKDVDNARCVVPVTPSPISVPVPAVKIPEYVIIKWYELPPQ